MKKKKKFYFFKGYVDEGEKILDVAHKHVLILKVKGAKTSFFGVAIPIILYLLFPQLILVWGIWSMVGVCGMIYNFFDWYFDAWVLTDQGIIDIDQDGFFTVTTTRLDYHMIEGIAYTISGFWRTLFNFGDITIDKIGAKTSVVLKDAANPKKLERKVMAFQEKYIADKSIKDHQNLKDMLAGMIAYHMQNEKIVPSKQNKSL